MRLARSTLSGEFAAVKKVKRLPSSDKVSSLHGIENEVESKADYPRRTATARFGHPS